MYIIMCYVFLCVYLHNNKTLLTDVKYGIVYITPSKTPSTTQVDGLHIGYGVCKRSL